MHAARHANLARWPAEQHGSIAWQLMREDTTRFLRTLAMDERDILCWANYRVRTAASTAASGGAPSSSADRSEVLQVRRFADPALTSGVFMLQLLTAVGAECVNATAVLPGATPDECEANARYAISCAHKMGCRVFCVGGSRAAPAQDGHVYARVRHG